MTNHTEKIAKLARKWGKEAHKYGVASSSTVIAALDLLNAVKAEEEAKGPPLLDLDGALEAYAIGTNPRHAIGCVLDRAYKSAVDRVVWAVLRANVPFDRGSMERRIREALGEIV